jgi:hemerythrin-like domain-containing protein
MNNFQKKATPPTESEMLEELRLSIEEDSQNLPKFIGLLKKHHDYLQTGISILTDKEATVLEKQASLAQFLHVLNMHAQAEEETLYETLHHHENKDARLEGIAGQDEHDLAYQLGGELKDMAFEKIWSEEVDAKAKVLATLVLNHLQEEETTMFPIAQKSMGTDELNQLALDYLELCKSYLEIEINTPFQPSQNQSPSASF